MSAARCRCGKYSYVSARVAWRVVRKAGRKPDAPPLQAYRCKAGSWHIRTAVDHRRRAYLARYRKEPA